MGAILPYLCLILIILNIRIFELLGWRGSMLFGAVVWGFFITIITEALNLFRLININSILISWICIFTLLLVLLVINYRKNGLPKFKIDIKSLSTFDKFSLLVILIIIAVVGIISFSYPPNNWDSMTYHMSRIMHWIQNQSIDFYPTSITRQLFLNPWTEFAILHLQILNKGDYFANSVQFFCMIGSIIGVSLIAKELKASNRGQIMSGVICATIPMGILQGSSTQNDFAVAFWLVCFVYFGILLIKKPKFTYAIGVGSSLGLSILTKATAYIYAVPFIIWIGFSLIKRMNKKKFIMIILIGTMTLAINSGFYLRNNKLCGHPLGITEESDGSYYVNEIFSPASLASNIIRNIALQLGSPFAKINETIEKIIVYLHKLINLSPSDARITYLDTSFHIPKFYIYEDTTSNLFHLILAFSLSLLYFVKKPRNKLVGIYLLLIVSAFLLFCVYLKWQPWHSRLHLALFVLISPFLGYVLSQISNERIHFYLISILILYSLPFLLINRSRPIIGINLSGSITAREEQYFNNRTDIKEPFLSSVNVFKDLNCSNIGLLLGGDSYEYPLWALLDNYTGKNAVLRHVNVTNISKNLEDPIDYQNICALFTENSDPPEEIYVEGKAFSLYWSDKPINVYSLEPDFQN